MKIFKLTLKAYITALVFVCGLNSSYAQGGFFGAYEGNLYQRTTIFSTLGLSGYGGDLAGPLEISRQNSYANPAFFVGLSYRLTNNISLRGQIGMASITINDPKDAWKALGVNGVNTTIIEPSASLEFDLISKDAINLNEYNFNVSIIVGVASSVYYPYTTDGDQSLRGASSAIVGRDVAPNDFGNFDPALLTGVGFQYYLTNQLSVGAELIGRLSSSDYIDGFGPIKFGTANDMYFTGSAAVRYTLEANYKRYNYKKYLKRMSKRRPLR